MLHCTVDVAVPLVVTCRVAATAVPISVALNQAVLALGAHLTGPLLIRHDPTRMLDKG